MKQKSLADYKEIKPVVDDIIALRNRRQLIELYERRYELFNKLLKKLKVFDKDDWRKHDIVREYRQKVRYIDSDISRIINKR